AAQIAQAAQDARAMLGARTLVLTIQNGLGSADVVAQAVGGDRLLVGVAAAFGASLRAPGHARHEGMAAIRMGAYAGDPATAPTGLAATHADAIATVWREAGFNAQAVTDVLAMQWEKLICNVAYSAPCALTGMTVGQAMDDPEIGAVSRAAAVEALQVARARGVAVSVTDAVEHVRAFGARIPDARPSVLLDHVNRRVSEIDVINGAIPRQAALCGMQAPVNATLTALVKQREQAFG
ncbi:MAG: 2-dehydropantoate 2-reductase, partial [Burkholderiaceae bacterium]